MLPAQEESHNWTACKIKELHKDLPQETSSCVQQGHQLCLGKFVHRHPRRIQTCCLYAWHPHLPIQWWKQITTLPPHMYVPTLVDWAILLFVYMCTFTYISAYTHLVEVLRTHVRSSTNTQLPCPATSCFHVYTVICLHVFNHKPKQWRVLSSMLLMHEKHTSWLCIFWLHVVEKPATNSFMCTSSCSGKHQPHFYKVPIVEICPA